MHNFDAKIYSDCIGKVGFSQAAPLTHVEEPYDLCYSLRS
jgi:hypothetical protein